MLRSVVHRGGTVRQSELRQMLGVCNSVISIMVRALERLGFLGRYVCEQDRRTFVVRATALGRHALRCIYRASVVERFHELMLVSVFAKDHISRQGVGMLLYRLLEGLHWLRNAFGAGWLRYDPWTATDGDESFYFADVLDNPVRDNGDGFMLTLRDKRDRSRHRTNGGSAWPASQVADRSLERGRRRR
jgi:DNA-binding MarR family transcriptional regulator